MATSFFVDGRYTDAWVVDRTLFEHLSGGMCSCCGISHASAGALMQSCSDIETDDSRKERKSPWPQAMSDEVWAGRLKLRISMKENMAAYKQFWEDHGQAFSEWWVQLPLEKKRRILSMPVDEVLVILHDTHDIKGAYFVLMTAANDQVRHFKETGIHGDGRSPAELSFEEGIQIDHGAFMGSAFLGENCHDLFFDLCQQTGGPRLLSSKVRESRPSPIEESKDKEGASAPFSFEDIDRIDGDALGKDGQSFRADRRLVRLIIFRRMFDKAIHEYRMSIGDDVSTDKSTPVQATTAP